MENYYQAKKRLFTMCKSAIVCVDDDWGRRLAEELATAIPVTTYSVSEPVDFYAVNIKATPASVSYWLSDTNSQKTFPVKCPMPGLFNVANSIAAIAAAKSLGFDTADCITALGKSAGVRGRCEVIHSETPAHPFTVICDYAHTTDALAKILTCVKTFAKRRVICVFGAAGERDADKRPSMGAVAAKYADFLIVTSDNPRFENPDDIIAQVVSGIPKRSVPYETFADRREAIAFALSDAREDDIILLAGKGHEKYQVIGDEEQPFDERTIVQEILTQ
jgi:UDP-N-acetylmuramoyl-L-alanyl-D-glutamate--2,6-diaminopimelate ligase